ncbi:MAG: hypothetical protein ACYCO3_03510 [Mycobacteriales bacterium]
MTTSRADVAATGSAGERAHHEVAVRPLLYLLSGGRLAGGCSG